MQQFANFQPVSMKYKDKICNVQLYTCLLLIGNLCHIRYEREILQRPSQARIGLDSTLCV